MLIVVLNLVKSSKKLHFAHNVLNISAMLLIKILAYGKNMTDILRTKARLNFVLSLILKGGKNAPSVYQL